MAKKSDERHKMALITGGAIALVVMLGLLWLMNSSGGGRLLATRMELDVERTDVTGFQTYQPFFRRAGGQYDVNDVDFWVNKIGDGELPDNLTASELEDIQRVLAKSRSATFAQLAPAELVEAAQRILQELVNDCSLT